MVPVNNPRFDYNFNFIESGEYPQNYILNNSQADRYHHYPKMENFISKKRQHIEATNHPAMSLRCDPLTLRPADIKSHFDVILIEPPLLDYKLNLGVDYKKFWSWNEIEQLPIDQLAGSRAFVWLWCGSVEGLNRGRDCLKKWGFRRCEDICWIKTNKIQGDKSVLENGAIFHRTKEHCLMGIKGTVKRSTDGEFIHANVDVDVIVAEEDPDIRDKKPEELFNIIENFCLGRRRLHIFGRDHSVRPGWLTVGPDLNVSNFNSDEYSGYFNQLASSYLTGSTVEIESMRPKSPPPKELKQPATASISNETQMKLALFSEQLFQQPFLSSHQLNPNIHNIPVQTVNNVSDDKNSLKSYV